LVFELLRHTSVNIMGKKRALALGFTAAALIVIAIALASPPGQLMIYSIVIEEMFPDRISWDGKTAWKRCDSAIANRTSWPSSPQAACAAMSLCANEAPLTAQQTRLLDQAIRGILGCRP
jgi:hypothetical protein